MKCIHLFAGINGFGVAADWMGWENVAHCEIDPFCRAVIAHYWPHADLLGDIIKTDFKPYRNASIDVLTGGFPCQPYSLAGKRRGADDDRALWQQMLRAIHEIKPRFVVGENVAGLLSMAQHTGAPPVDAAGNPTGNIGDVYSRRGAGVACQIVEAVQLEGYEVQIFTVPACAVNAPHRRDRVWIVARRIGNDANTHGDGFVAPTVGQKLGTRNDETKTGTDETRESSGRTQADAVVVDSDPHGNGQDGRNGTDEVNPNLGGFNALDDIGPIRGVVTNPTNRGRGRGRNGDKKKGVIRSEETQPTGRNPIDTNANNERLQGGEDIGGTGKSGTGGEQFAGRFFRTNWDEFPTQSPVCGRNDGISTGLSGTAFLGKKLTPGRHRQESIKAYGNAVVPQVVFAIYKAIEEMDKNPIQ